MPTVCSQSVEINGVIGYTFRGTAFCIPGDAFTASNCDLATRVATPDGDVTYWNASPAAADCQDA